MEQQSNAIHFTSAGLMGSGTPVNRSEDEMKQQTPESPNAQFATRGFWLPCDQTQFFRHEKDKLFRKPAMIVRDEKPSDSKPNNKEEKRVAEILDKEAATNNQLDDHVLHRLALVLSRKRYGYTHMVPAYHSSNPYGEDPDAAVFVNMTFTAPDIEFINERDEKVVAQLDKDKHVTAKGIALLVNSSGFYLWVLHYQHDDSISDEAAQAQVDAYLKRYLYWVVGGNFASRYSGRKEDRDLASQYERDNSLQRYERDWLGILTFAQINTIFEGLFSSALDFRVFFYDTASGKHERVDRIRRSYSLGRFIKEISTSVGHSTYHAHEAFADPGQNAIESSSLEDANAVSEDVTNFLIALDLLHPKSSTKNQAIDSYTGITKQKKVAHNLCFDFLGEWGCGILLRKFLQATAQITLLRVKRRIEYTRRELVAEILQVTQRQDPLLQVEIPPSADEEKQNGTAANLEQPSLVASGRRTTDGYPSNNSDNFEDGDEFIDTEHIPEVNESQLRGYVLLVSAQLPLISNVGIYLSEITITNDWYRRHEADGHSPKGSDQQQSKHPPKSPSQQTNEPVLLVPAQQQGKMTNAERAVYASLRVWQTLLRSVQEDLAGLEHAIEQERQDRMVQEEEKIRVEQETLAEIERLQDRNSKSLSPRATFTLSFVSNVFAIASVLVAVFGTNLGTNITNFPTDSGGVSKFLSIILLLALGLSALYVLAQYLFFWGGSLVVRLLRIPFGNRYYYEMDIHVDAPLNDNAVRELLSGQLRRSGRGERLIEAIENTTDTAWIPFKNERIIIGIRFWTRHLWPAFRRSERNSYRVERSGKNEGMHKVYLEVTALLSRHRWYHILHPSVQAVLVYEILFHRPGGEERYILNDVRVVSTQRRILEAEQLTHLKIIVADYFVNPLITDQSHMTWDIVTTPERTLDGHERRADALMAMTTSTLTLTPSHANATREKRWQKVKRRAQQFIQPGFTALMQLGLASAFLFLLRGLLNVVAVAARGGLDALNSISAVAQALYLTQIWDLFLSVSWGLRLLIVLIPSLVALVLAAIPSVRYAVRATVIQALDQQAESGLGNYTPNSLQTSSQSNITVATGANNAGNDDTASAQRSALPALAVRRQRPRFLRIVQVLWWAGGWSGYILHGLFLIGKWFILWALATLSVVALLSVAVNLLARFWHLLFLLP